MTKPARCRPSMLNDYSDAAAAVREALRKTSCTFPEPLDYESSDWIAAKAEHLARMDRLRAVAFELGELVEHVAERLG